MMKRLGRSCLSFACSVLSVARSAQQERATFVRAAGVYRLITSKVLYYKH